MRSVVTSQFGVQWPAFRPDCTYTGHLHCLLVSLLSDFYFLLTALTPALTLLHHLAFCWTGDKCVGSRSYRAVSFGKGSNCGRLSGFGFSDILGVVLTGAVFHVTEFGSGG